MTGPNYHAGFWHCGICGHRYIAQQLADICCPHPKGLGIGDLDSTDLKEMHMEAELEQARKRIADLEGRLICDPTRLIEKNLLQARAEHAEAALRKCVEALEAGSFGPLDRTRVSEALAAARSVLP